MLNHMQITAIKPTDKTFKKGLGNGLTLIVDRTYKNKEGLLLGGRKYFRGRIRGKDYWVGTFGTNSGELSLKDAREKHKEIKDYCLKNEISYSDFKRNKDKTQIEGWTLNEAINYFLKEKKLEIKETTFKENKRKLKKVLSFIDENTPLIDLERRNGGKEIIEDIITKIEVRGRNGNAFDEARRCRNLLKQVFDLAEDLGKMGKDENPAFKKIFRKHKVTHHPTITWNEVPEVLEKVSLNPCNSHPVAQLATKLTLMTFLRSGALARLQWDWINGDLLTIDGKTSGLKRKRDFNDDIPHHIPITPHIRQIFERANRFSKGEKYIFLPLMQSRFPHLDPSVPNNFLRTLGYGGKLVAHGWRSVALTYGIDLLDTPKEVIKKQMGHLPDNKVDRAYDRSLMLKERRTFLNKWCDLLVANGLEV